MDRRTLLALAFAPALTARAQPAGAPMRRIGVLSFGSAPSGPNPDPILGFREGLRALGHVEGRNLDLVTRYADGRPEQVEQQAAELAQMKVDAIFAGGPATMRAARNATNTIPIVVVGGSDPVREGWARSLARPGGNITGITVTFPELGPKRIELLRQAVPGLTRAAVLAAPAELDMKSEVESMSSGAAALGVQLQWLEVGTARDAESVMEQAKRGRAQGLYALATNTIVSMRLKLAELALAHRLPSISDFPLLAEAGLMMTYGADLDALGRRAAIYIDKILKGAQPADLPIERPTVFELVLNLKTARAIGAMPPQGLMLQASRLIE